jgi:hypothetical protein
VRTVIIATSAAAALSSSPVFAQPSQGRASIPDFSGIWSHPSFPGFEPLPSGPTSLRNRSRQYVCPITPCPEGRGSFDQLVGDYTSPILKTQAAEIVKKHGEISRRGGTYPIPTTHCWARTRSLHFQRRRNADAPAAGHDHISLSQRSSGATPAYEFGSLGAVTPSWYGDSIGHYEVGHAGDRHRGS